MDFVKYTFNPVASDGTTVDLIPTMTDGFVYTVTDVTNDDGTITRTLSCEDSAISGLTKMQFGQDYNASDDNPINKSLALLSVDDLNVSTLTSCNSMFRKCQNVTSINTENFDTSNVTTMNSMFHNCSKLTTLDLSNFNTSNVTDMYAMFDNCSKLTALDVSNFNTSKVTNMGYMFQNCSKLTTLDLSDFDTSKVTTMQAMFANCSSLTALDVSNFNTSKVINMSNMFQNCSSLTTLDLSNFDTSNVTNMNGMFDNCSKLTALDVSNFNTSKVTNMGYMFQNCSKLTALDLSNFNTSKVTNMYSMFRNCSKLTTLDVSNFDTSNVTNMNGMFDNCSTAIGLLYCSEDTITALANAVTSACDFYITSNNLTSPNSLANFIEYREEKKVVLYLNPETQAWEKPVLRQWDTIEKHSDGKYYYHKRSGEVVLNGSEDWKLADPAFVDETHLRVFYGIKDAKYGLFTSLINDKLPCVDTRKYRGISFTSVNNNLHISLATSELQTFDIAGFKAWLQANPTTVVYQLEQEEVYECTSLDLITYEGETNYIVSSGAISPISTLKVHNNISNVVSILQEKVSLLETKFTEMFKFMLSGDYQSLAFSLYPSDFATIDITNESEE